MILPSSVHNQLQISPYFESKIIKIWFLCFSYFKDTEVKAFTTGNVVDYQGMVTTSFFSFFDLWSAIEKAIVSSYFLSFRAPRPRDAVVCASACETETQTAAMNVCGNQGYEQTSVWQSISIELSYSFF